MKFLILAFCGCLFGMNVFTSPLHEANQRRLGVKQCTYGPTFWCFNITNANSCNAMQHCIQTVWEKQTLPQDNDSICKICLDMVEQARNQLESNETQEDLKAVFEGSCKLIPLKIVRKECIKLADDFTPELVEALASQMNPNVVCSVAGLCNNAIIDEMLEDSKNILLTSVEKINESKQVKPLTCDQCNTIGSLISTQFYRIDPDDLLDKMLHICGKFGSFSDACSNILIVHFTTIYKQMEMNLNSKTICHMSGVCSGNYHRHDEYINDDETSGSQKIVQIRPMSKVGHVKVKDDIPCELCEQLVKHLRDVLIANTTEDEFRLVLEGFCKQTGHFASECNNIVQQYYDVIYKNLINNLDANGACYMIGICPKGITSITIDYDELIMPLLPITTPQEIYINISKNTNTKLLGAYEPKLNVKHIQNAQLPIDRILGSANAGVLVQGGELCTMCEYVLHFLQEELASPMTEEHIKEKAEHTCEKLPNSAGVECNKFIDMYGDAIIALLIQNMDPRALCPLFKLCPKIQKYIEVFASQPIDVTINTKNSGTDKCPICLFAIAQVEEMIKSDKSKENVKNALDKLCIRLPNKMQMECNDFVTTYTAELMEMLASDFTPTDICVYLKCCSDKKAEMHELNVRIVGENEDIMTNQITDNTGNGEHVFNTVNSEYLSTPNCLLCVEIVKEVEKKVIHQHSKKEIKDALEHACDRLHKMKNKCKMLIDKHGDRIADLILQEMTPKVICKELGYCINIEAQYQMSIATVSGNEEKEISNIEDATGCMVCKVVMAKLEHDIQNTTNQKRIEDVVKSVCKRIPTTLVEKCDNLIDEYGVIIINLLINKTPKDICSYLNLCIISQIDDVEVSDAIQISFAILPIDTFVPKFTDISDNLICEVCQLVMVQIEKKITDINTKEEILELMKGVCKILPNTRKGHCNNFVDEYGDIVISLIGTMPPREICGYIKLCIISTSRPQNEMVDCVVCYGAVMSIESIIKEYKFEKEIKLQDITEEACNTMPSKYYRKCSILIEYYGHSIINILRTSKDNGNVCSKIGICLANDQNAFTQMFVSEHKTTEERPRKDMLVGANRCLWGPSYWCDSKDTASECRAHQFCSENHWENGIPPIK